MFERRILVLLSMMAMGLAGCAWDAGYQKTAGPTLSRDGVEVRVVGQECYLNRSADEVVRIDGDQLDIKVKLQVRNDTNVSLTVYPEEITLVDSEVQGGPSTQSHPASAFTVDPGASKRFALWFTKEGELDCSAELALQLGRSVTLQGSPVAMPVLNLASSH